MNRVSPGNTVTPAAWLGILVIVLAAVGTFGVIHYDRGIELTVHQYKHVKAMVAEVGPPLKVVVDQYMEDGRLVRWEYEQIKRQFNEIALKKVKKGISRGEDG